MSEKETELLKQLHDEIKLINLTLKGDKSIGVEGVVPLLQRHMEESKSQFKQFKRDIAYEYVNDINSLSDRLKPLEKAEKVRYKNLGIFSGVGFILGNFCWYMWEHLKPVVEFFSGK